MDHAVADRIYADFARCFNARDMDGVLELYEPDAVFVRGPGDHASGRAAIGEALQEFFDTGGTISFRTRHAVQHGNIALLSNEYTLQGTDADGEPFTLTGKTAEVLRQQPDGRWLYIIDHPAGAGINTGGTRHGGQCMMPPGTMSFDRRTPSQYGARRVLPGRPAGSVAVTGNCAPYPPAGAILTAR